MYSLRFVRYLLAICISFVNSTVPIVDPEVVDFVLIIWRLPVYSQHAHFIPIVGVWKERQVRPPLSFRTIWQERLARGYIRTFFLPCLQFFKAGTRGEENFYSRMRAIGRQTRCVNCCTRTGARIVISICVSEGFTMYHVPPCPPHDKYGYFLMLIASRLRW